MKECQGEKTRKRKIENSNGKNNKKREKTKNEGMSWRKSKKPKFDDAMGMKMKAELDRHEVRNDTLTKVECNNIADEKG